MTLNAAPHPVDVRAGPAAVANALAAAVAAAARAPSTHNTQPWQWRTAGDSLDLHLDASRLLRVADPDTRLATLSCGASLNHARVSLAALGWRATVTRIPDPRHPEHLAHLRVDGPAPVPVDAQTMRRAHYIGLRHTDRRPPTGRPIGPPQIDAIVTAVEAEGALLHILRPDQVLDLATAAGQARRTDGHEARWQAELAHWTGGAGPIGYGDLPVGAGHDRASVFAILYGRADRALDWLHAGEALSAAWLTATEIGVAVLPLTATIEMTSTRQAMRVLLPGAGYPCLVLRLGTVPG